MEADDLIYCIRLEEVEEYVEKELENHSFDKRFMTLIIRSIIQKCAPTMNISPQKILFDKVQVVTLTKRFIDEISSAQSVPTE